MGTRGVTQWIRELARQAQEPEFKSPAPVDRQT